MKKIFFLYAIMCSFLYTNAQNNFTVIIENTNSEKISGATVILQNSKWTVVSDINGLANFKNINNGKHEISVSHIGYITQVKIIYLPLAGNDTVMIFLTAQEDDLDEVIVQSTRTGRTIGNTPTRIEVIDEEEVDEKSNMRPSNVSMILHESTGLQVQQTSATSGNASIRVQGLDGRYTQLLKDGYPNFGNFASGLSILEIPPLDLKQVEVIKGPSSTLYGGGAIAGVVNFISKTPSAKGEYNAIINQSNVGQTNVGIFASHKKGKWGYTFLGAYNIQSAYDVDKDGFSELPKSKNFTINPVLYYYPNETVTIVLGNSFTRGNSLAGDMQVIKDMPDNSHVYFEKNKTTRNTTTFSFQKKYDQRRSLKIKQSLSLFDRNIDVPGYNFSGFNTNSFTDASYIFFKSNHTVIVGANFIYDNFSQKKNPSNNLKSSSFTSGVYVQDTWDISSQLKLEYGARLDYVAFKNINYNKKQAFILPRTSLLYKINNKLSTRLGAGLGYKTPTIFTEQTETLQYRNVLPLSGTKAEKSIGGTFDVNYKTNITDDLSVSLNQMFFYTSIQDPLILQQNLLGDFYFINTNKPVISKGFETNLKLIYKENLKLFGGYTFTYAKNKYQAGNQFLPLLPKSKINLSLVYEKEDDLKIGLEGYYTGKQYLYNGFQTPAFWEFGVMAQKTFGKFSLFINFENITDERQSKYKGVVNAPFTNPSFDDIWNHTEGFVINGGIKIKF